MGEEARTFARSQIESVDRDFTETKRRKRQQRSNNIGEVVTMAAVLSR